MVELPAFNRAVTGSNPVGTTLNLSFVLKNKTRSHLMIFGHLPTIPVEQDGLYATACGKVFWVELTSHKSYYNAVPDFAVGDEPQLSWDKFGNILCVRHAVHVAFNTDYRIVAFLSRKRLEPPSGYEFVGGHPTFGRTSESPYYMGMSGTESGQYVLSAALASFNMTPFEKEKIGSARILLKQIHTSLPDPPKTTPDLPQEDPKENVVSTVNQPIFNDAPTCPIDKDGGWYVTANGLVVQLKPMQTSGYAHPDHHKPMASVRHNLNMTEAVWWHTNGDVYMQGPEYKKLCQPALRIVAKLLDFTEDLPAGLKFKGGHPHFSKVDSAKDYAWVSINCIKNQKISLHKVTNPSSLVYNKNVSNPTIYSMIDTARICVDRMIAPDSYAIGPNKVWTTSVPKTTVQNEIFVNPVPTPVSKEVAMSPVPPVPTPEVAPQVAQNPVVQIAKATGNFAVRGTNYWLAQPTMIMGGYVVRSLRFIFASAVIGSVVGSISYPDTAKRFAASLVPKVELKIEKPSILK